LTYFNSRGKAEVIRLTLALAGVEFTDERHEFAEWPGDIKKTLDLPFGQLPTLTVDGGTVYSQALPITRYLAEKYGLTGKTPEDNLRGDMIVHCTEDILMKIIAIYREQDADKKAMLQKTFTDEELPTACGNFEKMLKHNKGGNGFIIGDSLTWADLHLYQMLKSYVTMAGVDLAYLEKFPILRSLTEHVDKNAKIAAWIAKRPVTPF